MNRRISIRYAALGVVLLCAAMRPAGAQGLPKAEAILDKYVEVTGGKAAYARNHSETCTGAMEFVGKGIKGTVSTYTAEPDKSYTEINLEGVGKMEEGSDGKVAWSLSALQGPHVKDGDEKTQALQESRFNAPIHWRDIYKQAETTGVETVGGRPCYKVVLTPAEGVPSTRYFDQQTGLLVKTTLTVKSPMGEIPVEAAVSDYRKEGDLLVPHKMVQKVAGMEIALTIATVKYNAAIPKDRFEIPEEVKALVNKK